MSLPRAGTTSGDCGIGGTCAVQAAGRHIVLPFTAVNYCVRGKTLFRLENMNVLKCGVSPAVQRGAAEHYSVSVAFNVEMSGNSTKM